MKVGDIFKYVLNINTIWAFMILLSFGVAIYRQATPQVTPLSGALVEGPNKLLIQYNAKNKDSIPIKREFTITNASGRIALADADTKKPGFDSFDPWLVDVTATKSGASAVSWRSPTYGTYSVELNGKQIVKKGELVTLERVTDAMFTYAQKGFDIGIGLVSAFVLLLGLMKVGEDAGIVALFAKALSPLLRILFTGVPKDHPANGAIVMNITTSILGLGNASTPMGLKAIAELQKLNPRKDTATDAMCMLVGYNTSGFAIIATSMIATMKSAGTNSPLAIIGPTIAAGFASTVAAFITVKVLGATPIFRITYTQEELDALAKENAQ